MGTHPIFESDFDCLTEKIVENDWSFSQKFWPKFLVGIHKISNRTDLNMVDSKPYTWLSLCNHVFYLLEVLFISRNKINHLSNKKKKKKKNTLKKKKKKKKKKK